MINLEKANKEFIKYTNKFDVQNYNIQRKVDHSIRVMNLSKRMAENLNLEQEEVELATLIGLLHDIGRFEQYNIYKTYNDLKSIDHGEAGVEILEDNEYIRKFVEDNRWDPIIKKAIVNHNKYELEKGLSEQEKSFCNIIKDCDKIDILYLGTEVYWKEKEKLIQQEKISKEVEELFYNEKLIDNRLKNTQIDQIIGMISFIYDINFKESFEIIRKEDYINKIINRFEFNEDIKERIEKIRKYANDYIKEKSK